MNNISPKLHKAVKERSSAENQNFLKHLLNTIKPTGITLDSLPTLRKLINGKCINNWHRTHNNNHKTLFHRRSIDSCTDAEDQSTYAIHSNYTEMVDRVLRSTSTVKTIDDPVSTSDRESSSHCGSQQCIDWFTRTDAFDGPRRHNKEYCEVLTILCRPVTYDRHIIAS